MKGKEFLLVIVVFSMWATGSTEPSTLRKVFIMSRHGDRSPTLNYPNLHHWYLLGELSGEGMYQMFEIGEMLRERYIFNQQFLPDNYHLFKKEHLYVRSTDKDRTLMSAQSLLLGLYPPGTGPYRANGVDAGLPHHIQSIPIHSESSKNDLLLHAYKHCPKISHIRKKKVKSSDEWLEKETETEDLRKRLATILGVNELSLGKIATVYHSLKAEKLHIKSDLNQVGISDDDYEKITQLKDWVLHRKYWFREMGKLGTGNLLRHIVEEMCARATGNVIDPLMSIYSAHDGTILSMFSAMGLQDNFDIPLYASYVIWELHEPQPGNFRVVVRYNDKPLLPQCEESCTLEEFTRLMKDGMITEEEYKSQCFTEDMNKLNLDVDEDKIEDSTHVVEEEVCGESCTKMDL